MTIKFCNILESRSALENDQKMSSLLQNGKRSKPLMSSEVFGSIQNGGDRSAGILKTRSNSAEMMNSYLDYGKNSSDNISQNPQRPFHSISGNKIVMFFKIQEHLTFLKNF